MGKYTVRPMDDQQLSFGVTSGGRTSGYLTPQTAGKSTPQNRGGGLKTGFLGGGGSGWSEVGGNCTLCTLSIFIYKSTHAHIFSGPCAQHPGNLLIFLVSLLAEVQDHLRLQQTTCSRIKWESLGNQPLSFSKIQFQGCK